MNDWLSFGLSNPLRTFMKIMNLVLKFVLIILFYFIF